MQLHASRLKGAEYERTIHRVVPETATPFEELFNPGFWAHVAAKLKPFDRIEVLAEDGSYYAELLVRDCGRLWAKMGLILKTDFEALSPSEPVAPTHEIVWRGPHAKFGVKRKADNAVLKDGFPDKGEASRWLSGHLKAIAA